MCVVLERMRNMWGGIIKKGKTELCSYSGGPTEIRGIWSIPITTGLGTGRYVSISSVFFWWEGAKKNKIAVTHGTQ